MSVTIDGAYIRLDVTLSTRATEAKQDSIIGKLKLIDYEDRLISGDLTGDGVQYSSEVALGTAATDVFSKIVELVVSGNLLWAEFGLTAEFRADMSGIAVWAASTGYALGDVVKPTGGYAGCVYECTTAGTSGTAEPTWPTDDGATVSDNTVTWTTRRYWLKWQWQARNKGGTFVNIHSEVNEDAPSETYFTRTAQGYPSLVANFNSIPYEVKLIAYRRDVAGTAAKARVKSSSYARNVFQAA